MVMVENLLEEMVVEVIHTQLLLVRVVMLIVVAVVTVLEVVLHSVTVEVE